MVVLSCLLKTPDELSEWPVDEIAYKFKKFFLDHPGYLQDYGEMATHPDPTAFPLTLVAKKLLDMPLKFMSNKKGDFFILDKKTRLFILKPTVRPYWRQPDYRKLLMDRITFAIKRYFYRSDKRTND